MCYERNAHWNNGARRLKWGSTDILAAVRPPCRSALPVV